MKLVPHFDSVKIMTDQFCKGSTSCMPLHIKLHKSFHLYLTFKQVWGGKNMSDCKQFQELRFFFPFVKVISGRGNQIFTLYYYPYFNLLSP